jgi:HTH-type transcriptional regulator/antitoxin HipB
MSHTTLRTPADIGALIRDRRHAIGLDQAGLADRAGVSRLWINQVERGKPGASMGRILQTLMVLGIELTGETPGQPHRVTATDAVTPDIDAIIDDARGGRDK